jgi:hypothetical protein
MSRDNSSLLSYNTEDDTTKIETRLKNEANWLN